MSTETTPRPWRVHVQGARAGVPTIHIIAVDPLSITYDPKVVPCVAHMGGASPNTADDAALIVRAVNAHDALVSALETAMILIRNTDPESVRHEQALASVTNQCAAALTLARGDA